MTVGRYLN